MPATYRYCILCFYSTVHYSCTVIYDVESGQVFTWGYGYLGLGPDTTLKTAPTLLPAPLFGANVYRPDVVVKDIFAGVLNFAAINSKVVKLCAA